VSSLLTRQLQHAERCLRAGDSASARAACEQVLKKAPRNPGALFLLGLTHLSTGRAEQSVSLFQQVLAVDARNGAAMENLGLAHLMLGQFAQAETALVKASTLAGAPPSVFMRLGIAQLEQGRAYEALPALRRAVDLDPRDPDALVNLGRALAASGDRDGGTARFQAALNIAPEHPDAAFNLGVIALQDHDVEAAERWFQRVLATATDYTPARLQLASILFARNQLATAAAHLTAVLSTEPDHAEALAQLASVQFQAGDLDNARSNARHAIALDPKLAGAYGTAANIALTSGDLEAAIGLLETGYERTHASELLGMLAFQLRQACDWQRWSPIWNDVLPLLGQDANLGSPFWLLCEPVTNEQLLAYTRRWAAHRFAGIGVKPRFPLETWSDRDSRRMKIGYLSADLHEHATAYLIAEMLEHHDRDRFEVFAYSYGPEDHSAMRQRLRSACEHFIDIARETDDVAVARIRADTLDVLIDLKGYTLGDRLTILARRPCPIQITWLGYPGTTGTEHVDYVIADAFIVPPTAEAHYAERVLRMPHCYQPNDRTREVGEPLSRAQYGLADSALVFCCFNQSYKITPEVYDMWMRLLTAVPGSVLWLLESQPLTKSNLLAAARTRGIAADRLVFAPRLPNAQHLARYRVADLALDTFPYGSHTTMSDALWCGCPAIALCGGTFASRVSGSLLNAIGMDDLVASSLDEYEVLARKLATDENARTGIRARLRHARDTSPLFDARMFARDLEAIFVRLMQAPR